MIDMIQIENLQYFQSYVQILDPAQPELSSGAYFESVICGIENDFQRISAVDFTSTRVKNGCGFSSNKLSDITTGRYTAIEDSITSSCVTWGPDYR